MPLYQLGKSCIGRTNPTSSNRPSGVLLRHIHSDGADPGAILDDGTGFGTNREGGLDYGWDCDGDTDLDYSGGRRGTNRDDGLGINHFDRDGTCGTTANPGRVNWQLAVPNGDYLATVDFGEEHYQHACEMEGVVACPDGDDCVVTNQPVTVTDGFFTITGYSHDVGTCHSISFVAIESAGGSGR